MSQIIYLTVPYCDSSGGWNLLHPQISIVNRLLSVPTKAGINHNLNNTIALRGRRTIPLPNTSDIKNPFPDFIHCIQQKLTKFIGTQNPNL